MKAPELPKGNRMEMKGTDVKDVKENAVSVEIGFEGTEDGVHEDGVTTLRRRPRPQFEEILVVQDPEESLKSERVQEALRAMPEWDLTMEGQAISRVKELPTPEVASLYTAYVTGFSGSLGMPVAVSVSGGLVLVTLYGPNGGDCRGGLTESVFDFARQIC
jgi:hypothetical protein